jgi:integral membrane sensor domain MASE1
MEKSISLEMHTPAKSRVDAGLQGQPAGSRPGITRVHRPNQLSIFPTAALTFVILIFGMKWNDGFTHDSLWGTVDSLVGASVCGFIAALAIAVARGRSWEVMVPLIFTGILLLVSLIFGERAGILGTVLAALLFALFLFHPKGSVQVSDGPARANLAWMLLLGISLSFFFAPGRAFFRRR